MSPDLVNAVVGAIVTVSLGWFVWVTASIFKLTQQVALMAQQVDLLKSEIKLLGEVKEILVEIRKKLDNRGGV